MSEYRGVVAPDIAEEKRLAKLKAGRTLVQLRNPRADRYVLVDRDEGRILEHRDKPGPYPGVPVARKRTIKDSAGEPSVPREGIRDAVRMVSARPERFDESAYEAGRE